MRTSKNSVPLIPLKDFGPSPFLEHGIFIEAFEDCVSGPAQTAGSPSTRLRRAFFVAGLWLGVNRFRKLSAVGEIAHRHRTWSRPRLARKEIDRTLYCLHSGILRWNKTRPLVLSSIIHLSSVGRSRRLFD